MAALGSSRGLVLLFLFALGLRLAAMLALGFPDRAQGAAWDWGWETACLAETLLDERPYGDTWGKGTGASGWLTPVYPAIVAGCMLLGGGITPLAAYVLFGLHALLSAATALGLVALGRTLGLGRVGLAAGWAFAMYPASIWYAVTNVWDTTLAACVLTFFFVVLLRLGPRPGRRPAFLIGLMYGLLLMINPAPLGLLPGVLLYLIMAPVARSSGIPLEAEAKRGVDLLRIVVFLCTTFIVCAPWLTRNQVVLGTFALRSNLGVEFNVGNNDLANGRHQTAYHPSHSERELASYRELGEKAYASACLENALAWMGEHPQRTWNLMARRVQIFWVGESPLSDPRVSGGVSAAEDPNAWIKWIFHMVSGVLALMGLCLFRRRKPEGLLVRTALFLFPAPYYLTHVMERYRFPIDPLLVFLAVWVAFEGLARLQRRS